MEADDFVFEDGGEVRNGAANRRRIEGEHVRRWNRGGSCADFAAYLPNDFESILPVHLGAGTSMKIKLRVRGNLRGMRFAAAAWLAAGVAAAAEKPNRALMRRPAVKNTASAAASDIRPLRGEADG